MQTELAASQLVVYKLVAAQFDANVINILHLRVNQALLR